MSATIPVLLELSRRSSQIDTHQEVNLNQVINEIIRDLSQVFSVDARVHFIHEEHCTVYADKVLVKMLIQNLIQNALQHTPGRINLSVFTDSISICDEGSEEQSLHFKSLVKSTLTENKTLTSGLGLYIVTLISERLSWDLDISSKPNSGSVVTVKFSLNDS